MAFVGWALLLVARLHSLTASSVHAHGNLTHHSSPSLCLPDQANALLKLKQSFFFDSYSTTTLPSWQADTDCCLWEGVGCTNSSGHVTALNLSGIGLYSLGIDPTLFNLTYLRLLDLSINDFGTQRYDISSVGFEKLSLLTHLNLSNIGITGQIPAGISKLRNLLSLDLGSYVFTGDEGSVINFIPNDLQEYYFHNLVVNLTNLRELILDGVSIYSRAEDCFKALAKFTPHLRVLSLEQCGLQGHIDRSLKRLDSLVTIKLSGNYGMTPGPFPEFIMNSFNLSVLELAGINLEGWFPRGIFQPKYLRVLDLSRNPNLLGRMLDISGASSLEILRLEMTNFTYAKSESSSNFSSVMELGLDRNFISTDFTSLFSAFVSVRKLVLTQINSPRTLDSVFSCTENIRNMTSLVLDECDLSIETTSSIGNLKGLTSLVISGSNLTMHALSAVTNLKNLKSFVIVRSHLSGQLPSSIGNMSNLEKLDIYDSHIFGPIPYEVGRMVKLTSLSLSYTGISSRIPGSIGNLTQLILLNLCENNLIGEISTSLFTLGAVRSLDLSGNQLSGPIQEFDVIASHLTLIDLNGNQLMGPIPESFFLLTNLRYLDISRNSFNGTVDLALLWRLENLTYLSLSNNKLSVADGEGSNDSSSTYLSALVILKLKNCNITEIPNFLARIKHMIHLDLSSNQISGNIPKWIWERWNGNLKSLNLSHNKFTSMEVTSYAIPFSNYLDTFDLSSNRLQGQIPMPSSSARILDYSNNSFSSILANFTLYLSYTEYLSLSKNNLSGYLPNSICDSYIRVLDISYNNFKGQPPPCLIDNGYMIILNLRENQFEGELPSNISSGCSLQTIDLHANKIEGQLPRALYNCTALELLDLGRNQITDTFPSWLGTLLNLRVLVLRSNQFHGSIGYLKDGKFGENFSTLQILDLASNNFSGNLHPQWFENLMSMEKYNNTGQIMGHQNVSIAGFYQDTVTISYKGSFIKFGRILTTLTTIDLSDNALEGSIPASIGKLVSLRALNMSHNAFTGKIPPQFGDMTAVESLDVSSNMLSGEIPQELTNLTFLSILNLSDNQLEGKIPQSYQFTTFQSGSFGGNNELCGLPLPKQCDAPNTPNDIHMKNSSDSVDIVLFAFVGVGFGMGFATSILVKLDWIKRWFCNVNSTNMT